jgi:autotransporter-associated beta strand protein
MKRSIRFASRFFVLPLLAAFAAAVGLVSAMAGPAHALVLDGTPQSFSGTESGTSDPGVNGSYFDNITDYGMLNLDGASYTVPTDRILAGTQGLLGLTPTVNALLYTGEISGFGMFTGVGGDRFSTGFSGTFTPPTTGDWNFRWSNDDRGAMYIDLNNDGTFQITDRVGEIAWTSGGTKALTEDTAYTYIYMTGDGGGGYNNDWYFSGPSFSETRPNAGATAQAGMWNVGTITYGELDFSDEDLVVNATTTLTLNSSSNVPFRLLLANDGTATINGTLPSISFTGTTVAAAATSGISTSASVTLGPVTIGAGSTLIATGSGTKTATSITLSGATGGITAGGTFNMGTYSDGSATKTLTLGGTGTKVMDNSAGGISAAQTTLRITGGTLDTTPTAVGANDPLGGATAIQLAGGTLKMQGQTTISNDALKATYYNNLPQSRSYIEFWSTPNLLSQTPVATATETGQIWYRSNGSEGKKRWSDLFAGQPDEGLFYVMWKGQYKPSVSSNKVIGSWEADNDYDAFVKINGNWERWRDWRNLDSANWYDMAITYANWDGYGSIRLPMHQSYQDWTLLDVSSGNSFGQFRFSTVGSLDMSARTVQLDASSEIAMTTDFAVSFGALTVNNGVLTLSGAPSTSFAGTTVNAAATQIGFNSAGTVDAGAIAGNSATATFVKAGAGTLTLNAGNTGLENVMFDVQGGKLIAVSPASMGGSASAQLSSGELFLSSTGGPVAYDMALNVTQNSTLTAGKAAGGASGQTVTLGSDGKLLTVQNGKILTVNATDGYALDINNSITLQDNATMNFNAVGGKINNNGAASLSMGGNSTLNLNAGTLTTDKALSVYNLNLNGGGLVQTGFGSAKDLYVGGTLKVDNAATILDLTGATLTTDPSATINLVNGQLKTEKALTVGNLTVESGGTLDMSGSGVDRDITVGDRLRLANKTFNTTGSTLSVGNRIELQSSSLTTDNPLTLNQLWMNDNSTFNTAAGTTTTINDVIELYNGSSANFTGRTLALTNRFRLENNATLTVDNPLTLNGQLEIYNNSKVDLGSNVLTTNWQNLYMQGNAELKAAGNLNINYLQIWDGGAKLNVPSVTLNDGAQFRSTDSRYGNNVHNFSIAENPGNPGRWMNIYGGGVDRNPNDGSADLYFNGTNTYTGRTQIMDATVLVANDGVGMPAGSTVRFENGVWGASGTITRTIGEDNTGGGKVFWGNWGGFAAYGGPLTVSLTPDGGVSGGPLFWNSDTQGFRSQGLYLGSSNATDNVTLTNNIEINSNAQINTQGRNTLATLSGNLTGGETLDKQGPGTLVLTGDNSGFSGRNYIRRGVLDVGNLATGTGLGTGRIDLQADTDDPNQKGAILQANGVLNKDIGNDNGQIRWEDNGGGFAARGGNLSVTLNSGADINWNDDPSGFRGRNLMFGSGTADNVVTLTNNIDAQNGYRRIYAFDNPNSSADKAVLSGNLMNLSGFEKRGDGVLETKGNAGLLSTSGDNVRIYDGGTLKVNGDLRAGDPYTDTDPRYIGSSDRNVENYDGKLVVTGNVQASWYYGGGSANSSNEISGNLTIRNLYEQNEGTAHIGGNLQTGENWVGVRNTTVLTVDGNLRAGAPSGSSADREVYSWGGGRMIVGGNVAANRLYFEQGKAANGQLPGITVGGTAYINGEVDLRTGPSTFNNLTANDVNVRYGADLTVNGNLTTNSLNTEGRDYWYGTERVSNIHLNGTTATINGGNGNININSDNPSSGYGVLDGSATVSANYVGIVNKSKLAGTLTLNVKDKVEIGENSVLSPGNSVGTLTIGLNSGSGGNLQMNNGSRYLYEGGDMVNVGGMLTVNDNWYLDVLATGQRLAAGGSLTLFNYGTLGAFDDTPTYDVSALIAAGWLPGDFDTGTLSFTTTGGSIVLNGIQAKPSVWTGDSTDDSNWQTSGNWDLAPAAGTVLQFAGLKRTTPNNNFDAGTSFGGIGFDSTAAHFHLVGNDMALAGDITNSSSNDQVVELNMNLTGPESNVNTGSKNVALSGNLSGVGGLTKTGSGMLTLSGNNAHTGATKISQGTLSVGSIGNGGAASNLGAAGSAASNLVFDGGNLQYTGAGNTTNRNFTINAGKTATIEVANGAANLTLAGAPVASTGGLTKTGPGQLTLTGANAYTGATSVSGGKLSVGDGGSGASIGGTSGVTLANNSNITFNHADPVSFSKQINGAGSLTKDGTGTLTLTSAQGYDGATVIAAGTLSLSGAAPAGPATWDFESGDLTGWTAITAPNGPNDLYPSNEPVSHDRLSHQGTYWIDTYQSNAGGSDGHSGILQSDSFILGTNAQISFMSGGGDFAWSGTPDAPGTLAGVALERLVEGVWQNLFWKSGNGNSMPTTNWDASAYAGETVRWQLYDNTTGGWGWVSADNIQVTSAITGQTAPAIDLLPTATALAIASGAVLDLNGGTQQVASLSDHNGGGGSVTNGGTGDATLTINGGTGAFSGVIGGGGGGAISLTKSGSGTQTLTGVNTYEGATTVNAGTLLVNSPGSLAAGSTVTVVGGTLGGTGTINGPVIVDLAGTLAPGASVGTLTIGGALTLAGDALFEINGTGDGEYDRVIGITDLTYGGTLTIETASLMGPFALHLFDFTTSQSGSFTAITDAGGHYTTGQLSMNYATGEMSGVPEPATLALLGLGGLGLILGRKRR